MLKRIRIQNYLFVQDQELVFEAGMTAFTGETGAGKSILVGAISLILAESTFQAQAFDKDKAIYLEADFELAQNQALQDKLDELGYDDEQEVTLARRISQNGRSGYFINGRKVNANLMKELKPFLIDFHHQRDQQRLLLPSFQLEILDVYADCTLLRKEHASLLQKLRSDIKKLDELRQTKAHNRQLEELYRFQLDEILQASITTGEEVQLSKEHEKIANSHKIREMGARISHEIYQDEACALDLLRSAVALLDRMKDLDESIANVYHALADAMQIISDCEADVNQLAQSSEDEGGRLELISQRLDTINSLLYKHRVRDSAELENLFAQKKAAILDFDSLDSSIEELEKQIDTDFQLLLKLGESLSEQRQKAAAKLSHDLQAGIRELAIPDARFEISIDKKAASDLVISDYLAVVSLSGAESCEFRFSANLGADLMPLADVASGGELSRVLLAIKKVLAGRLEPLLMILDEIDAGLGGKTAEAVAIAIKDLSESHQVFCVTHLAVIAAVADEHIALQKRAQDETTIIMMQALDASGRTLELARMLSGEVTQASLEHARQLLKTKIDQMRKQ